jgi:hypothetical protein
MQGFSSAGNRLKHRFILTYYADYELKDGKNSTTLTTLQQM